MLRLLLFVSNSTPPPFFYRPGSCCCFLFVWEKNYLPLNNSALMNTPHRTCTSKEGFICIANSKYRQTACFQTVPERLGLAKYIL